MKAHVYSTIRPKQALNYKVLKETLLERFEMTEEVFRKRFRNCHPEAGETLISFQFVCVDI